MTPVKLFIITRNRLEHILSEYPALEKRLLEMTLDELDAARDWMLLLGRKTAKEKIASFLAILVRRAAALERRTPGDGFSFTLPLTREAIADYLGLTIETVCRVLSQMKRSRLINFPTLHQFVVADMDRLHAIAEGEE